MRHGEIIDLDFAGYEGVVGKKLLVVWVEFPGVFVASCRNFIERN